MQTQLAAKTTRPLIVVNNGMDLPQHNSRVIELRESLLAYVRPRVSDIADAEDLVQDVFRRLALNNDDEIKNVRAWMFTVIKNTLADHYRNLAKRLEQQIDDVDNIAAGEESAQSDALVVCVSSLVASLAHQDSDILEKVDLEGKRLAVYARENKLGYSAAKSRVQRARRRLRETVLACCDVEHSEQSMSMNATPGSRCANSMDCCEPGKAEEN